MPTTLPADQPLWAAMAGHYAQAAKLWARHLFDSLVVVAFALVLVLLIVGLIRLIARHLRSRRLAASQARRISTIQSLVTSVVKYTIGVAAILKILSLWGVDTSTLVVGSAVLGAAIGFGSQMFIQDIISGLAILFEDIVAVGDFVEISGRTGVVERVGLRTVKIRDATGQLHVIFNRTVGQITNYTKGVLEALVDVSIETPDDAPKAQQILHQIAESAHQLGPFFPKPPDVIGLIRAGESDLFIRMRVTVVPAQQAAVQTFILDRIKSRFAAEQINIPNAQIRLTYTSDLFDAVRSATR